MLERIGDEYLESVRKEYETRRNVLYDALQGIPEIAAHKPKGAFYSVVRLPVRNAEDFAVFLLSQFALDKKTTFVAPAAGFYMQNEKGLDKIRVAYVLESHEIEEAVCVIAAGLEQYRKNHE